MSGPKYSNIELKKLQKRRLEEERRRKLEEAKLKQLEMSINKLHEEIVQHKIEIEEIGADEMVKLKEIFPEHQLVKECTSKKENILRNFQPYPSHHQERVFHVLQNYENQLKQCLIQSEDEVVDELIPVLEKIKNEIIIESENSLFQKSDGFERETKTFNLTLSNTGTMDTPKQTEEKVWKEWDDFLEAMNPYFEQELIANKTDITHFYQETKEILENSKLESTYKKQLIEQRRKTFLTSASKYDKEIELNKKLAAEYQSVVATYRSLCHFLNKDDEVEPFSVKHSHQQISTLKNDIALLEREWEAQSENEYISNSVNEIMESLGFDVIATDVLSTTKQNVIQQIYKFGDSTAINVSSSDQGSLLFQVTGLSEGKKTEVSTHEKRKVMEGMERFCEHYPVIQDELRKRGLQISNENAKPVSEQYVSFLDMTKKRKVKKRSAIQKQQIQKQYIRE